MTSDLRRAADLIEQAATEATEKGHHYAGVRLIGEEWAALLSLPVAAPLAAWLRIEADMADNPMCVVVEGAAKPLVARVPEAGQPFAIALARTILGES